MRALWSKSLPWYSLLATVLFLSGCATDPRVSLPAAPRAEVVVPGKSATPSSASDSQRAAASKQESAPSRDKARDTPKTVPATAPVAVSPAAEQLIAQAVFARQNGAMDQSRRQLEQAQRISPKAPQVYLALAEHYASASDWGRAEQFALKGVSFAGGDHGMRSALWKLIAQSREARGDNKGAKEAWRKAGVTG